MSRSCIRATELISIGLDRELTLKEKGSLKLHLMMCVNCRRCSEQMSVLHRITARRREDEEQNDH